MPIFDFKCPQEHTTEKLFLTFGAAEGVEQIDCTVCGEQAAKVEFSTPFPAHLHGNPDGWHKPSPAKRYSYKLTAAKGNNR